MSSTLEFEKTGNGMPTFAEMEDHLEERRISILKALQKTEESGLNTQDLRQAAGVPSGSMPHHTKLLERWGLIEEVDRVYIGQGSRAILWSLTERGDEFCDNWLEISGGGLASAEAMDDLAQRQATLEAMIQSLQEQVETLSQEHDEDIDDLEDRMQAAIQSLKNG
jgi:predicted ArsR family transcriptional regulator